MSVHCDSAIQGTALSAKPRVAMANHLFVSCLGTTAPCWQGFSILGGSLRYPNGPFAVYMLSQSDCPPRGESTELGMKMKVPCVRTMLTRCQNGRVKGTKVDGTGPVALLGIELKVGLESVWQDDGLDFIGDSRALLAFRRQPAALDPECVGVPDPAN